MSFSSKDTVMGSPGGSVVKTPPASARDMGVTPHPGGPHATRQLSLCAATTEPALRNRNYPSPSALEPMLLQQEKRRQFLALELQLDSSSHLLQLETSPCNNEDPARQPPHPKINKKTVIKRNRQAIYWETTFAKHT